MTTPKERYERLTTTLQESARRLLVSGMHIHAGFGDADSRIRVMTAMRRYLPLLHALSTSSPFIAGRETGYKSYRLTIIGSASAHRPAGPPVVTGRVRSTGGRVPEDEAHRATAASCGGTSARRCASPPSNCASATCARASKTPCASPPCTPLSSGGCHASTARENCRPSRPRRSSPRTAGWPSATACSASTATPAREAARTSRTPRPSWWRNWPPMPPPWVASGSCNTPSPSSARAPAPTARSTCSGCAEWRGIADAQALRAVVDLVIGETTEGIGEGP